MDPRPTSTGLIAAVNPTAEIPADPSSSRPVSNGKSRATIARRKNVKKIQPVPADSASSASSSICSCARSYSQKGIKISGNHKKVLVGKLRKAPKNIGRNDVDALGLPLGMSIAAVVSQVLVRKNAAGDKMSVDHLSEVCILAVRESLENVFGHKFNNFVSNFEKSFRSTLMTLRLINDSSQIVGEKIRRSRVQGNINGSLSLDKPKASSCYPRTLDDSEFHNHGKGTHQHKKDGYPESSLAEVSTSPPDVIEDFACTDDFGSLFQRILTDSQVIPHEQTDENARINLVNQQLILHDKQLDRQLSTLSNTGIDQSSMLNIMGKSVIQQTRSNDLKAFEIGLNMKKLQLKEKQLALNSHANVLERWKLSMGFSKASFKAEKFKTQLQDTRQIELLKKCLDFLVTGLILMLLSIAYGTYVYSPRRIIQATEACSPYTDSKSWWMPKSMATFNSGLQLLKCQIQVWSRMLFGALMIAAIAFLLIQRSASSQQMMPITFILVLLGVGCGYAGRFCIDTLGGSGYHWLMYWETLCLLHFLSNTFSSALYAILNGPIAVAELVEHRTAFPYWMRKSLFFAALLILPVLCGFMPFASLREWLDHFSSKTSDLTYD